MEQLLLDLIAARPPSFDNFEVGANAEAVAQLQAWLVDTRGTRSFVLYGPAGSGKSHLVAAALSTCPDVAAHDLATSPTPELEHQLFQWFVANEASRLLLALPGPLASSISRDDLRTRLGAGWVYALSPLSAKAVATTLEVEAKRRGIVLSSEVQIYLMTHFSRDMRSMRGLLDALDRASMRAQRPITIPLIREVAQGKLL